MTLPDRTEEAEDACVAAWTESDDTEGLEQLIEAAMEARRPMLAARLVQLIGDHYEVEPGSPLARAQRAARFVLANRPSPEDNSWSELEDAWREARKGRMNRIRRRMRQRMSGKDPKRMSRLERRRR